MTPERLLQVQEAYQSVIEQEPSRRENALAAVCAGDNELRRQVERLLNLSEEARDFLETQPPQLHTVDPSDSLAGKRVGAWRMVREIGRGGMGAVYLAERADESFQKQVAVKIVSSARGELAHRFRQEREILAAFDHPNIARLLDGGATEDGLHYLVMEYVAGAPITKYCDQRKLSINDRLKLFRKVCEAVQYAHRNLVVHRDLKPGNIFVTTDSEVKLLDFGIARLLRPEDRSSTGQQTLPMMTLDYASPEQVRGDAITTSSDVYSLGVTLYKLLTGHRPYHAKTSSLHEMARVICEEEPEAPSARAIEPQNFAEGDAGKLRNRLKGDLGNIILMAMRKEAARRYISVEQLSEDIGRFLENKPIIARKPTIPYRAVKFARRHPWRLALVASAALAMIVASITFFIRAHTAKEEAQRERRLLYEAQMRQSGYDLEEGNFTRLRATLESYLPKPRDEEDLRGFEWYLLTRRLHQEKLELKTASSVYSVAYSPDGKKLAAACEDGSAKIWETMTGKELLTLKANGSLLWAIAFSPDGRLLATGGADKMIRLCDTGDGREKATWKSDFGEITSLAFSPDGKKLLVGAQIAPMLIDISTGETLIGDSSGREGIFAVAFLQDGRRFVSGGVGGQLNWRRAHDGRWLSSITPHSGHHIFSLAVSSDERRLASSGGDKTAKIWDATTGEPVATFTGHTNAVRGVAFSPDDRRLITASADRTVRLWEVETREEIEIFRGHTDRIRAVAFSPDGRSVASGGDDQRVKIWDVTTDEKQPDVLRGHPQRVFSIAFSPDGRWLATAGGHDLTAFSIVWDVTTGRVIAELQGHTAEIRSIAFSLDGQQLATASADETIKIWDAITGRQLAAYSQPGAGPAVSVAFSPDGRLLAQGYDAGVIVLRETATGKVTVLKGNSKAPIWNLCFSSNSKLLASASWDGTVKLWEVASGRKIFTFEDLNKPITAVAFSPDGKLLAFGSDAHTVKLCDIQTGREIFTLAGHVDKILSVAFSPDGRRLASGSTDRTIRIWDVETGQELLALREHKDEVWSVAFSPDGRMLASGSWDKTARLWRLASDEEVRSIGKR